MRVGAVNVQEAATEAIDGRANKTPSPVFFSFYGLEGISPVVIGGGFKVSGRGELQQQVVYDKIEKKANLVRNMVREREQEDEHMTMRTLEKAPAEVGVSTDRTGLSAQAQSALILHKMLSFLFVSCQIACLRNLTVFCFPLFLSTGCTR